MEYTIRDEPTVKHTLLAAGFVVDFGNVEVIIWRDLESWEYYYKPTEEYFSGTFFVDIDRPKVVVDYDGVFELPKEVRFALTLLGYDISELLLDED